MNPNRIADAPELHRAAEADRSDLVLSLLKRGANPDQKDGRGWTALNVAAFFGNAGVVVTLLTAKANIEATTAINRYTALHTAADSGHLAVVEPLLWKGADVTAVTGKGWTALNVATYAGHHDVVSSLLDRGANVHATTTKGGWTALHTAAERGSVPITLLLLKKGADTKAVTKKGLNALHCAAHAGHEQVVRTLLDQKADVYSTVESSGYTALHLAAEIADYGVLTVLLEGGADVLSQTKDGQTALDCLAASEKRRSVTSRYDIQYCRHLLQDSLDRALKWIRSYATRIRDGAASDQINLRHFLDCETSLSTSYSDNGRLRLILNDGSTELALLYDLRADAGAATALGWLPLHLAVHCGGEGVIQTLLDLGAGVDAEIVGTNSTALKWAVIANKGRIVRILLRHGADVSRMDDKGWTVLLWAAYYGLNGMVQELLAHGANVATTSRNQRRTALHLAAQNAYQATVRQLLEGGADALARTRDGMTALDVTHKSDASTRTILHKAMEEARPAQHTQELSASLSVPECPSPSSYETRPGSPGDNDEIIPCALSNFIPELAKERIRKVWASPRQRPSALYNTKKFLERMDDLLSQDTFRQLIQHARDAPLNSNGDKTFMYFGSVKFIYNNVTVTVQAGINLLGDDNLISKNLLSLLGNPRKISERLYELLISALPLEPVLDPAVGFVGFPQAEVFKLDPEARYDAVFGYDFFNFQGKDLLRSAQRWHVVYEEFAMARLKAELSEKPVYQEDKFHFVESIRVCRPRNSRPYVRIRATFHTGRERSVVSRDVVRRLDYSGDETEIPLAFHFISQDKKYVWVFDVVEKLEAELVVGLDWLSNAGQSVLTRRQTSLPVIEPVPTSGKATLDKQATDLLLTAHRPASTSPHLSNMNSQVDEGEISDHRRTSDLAVPDPHHRPQSAPAQEKAENASCTDDWVSNRFIRRLESNAIGQDPIVVNIPNGVAVPTFTDFNGNDKQPGGTIMASWKMTHLNPHLMYDSTFYINDSPNAPFDVLLGSRTLFGKGIYTLSRTMHGSLPLIHKPISLLQSRHIAEGEVRTKAEIDRQDAWRRQQEMEEEEDRRRRQARARPR